MLSWMTGMISQTTHSHAIVQTPDALAPSHTLPWKYLSPFLSCLIYLLLLQELLMELLPLLLINIRICGTEKLCNPGQSA